MRAFLVLVVICATHATAAESNQGHYDAVDPVDAATHINGLADYVDESSGHFQETERFSRDVSHILASYNSGGEIEQNQPLKDVAVQQSEQHVANQVNLQRPARDVAHLFGSEIKLEKPHQIQNLANNVAAENIPLVSETNNQRAALEKSMERAVRDVLHVLQKEQREVVVADQTQQHIAENIANEQDNKNLPRRLRDVSHLFQNDQTQSIDIATGSPQHIAETSYLNGDENEPQQPIERARRDVSHLLQQQHDQVANVAKQQDAENSNQHAAKQDNRNLFERRIRDVSHLLKKDIATTDNKQHVAESMYLNVVAKENQPLLTRGNRDVSHLFPPQNYAQVQAQSNEFISEDPNQLPQLNYQQFVEQQRYVRDIAHSLKHREFKKKANFDNLAEKQNLSTDVLLETKQYVDPQKSLKRLQRPVRDVAHLLEVLDPESSKKDGCANQEVTESSTTDIAVEGTPQYVDPLESLKRLQRPGRDITHLLEICDTLAHVTDVAILLGAHDVATESPAKNETVSEIAEKVVENNIAAKQDIEQQLSDVTDLLEILPHPSEMAEQTLKDEPPKEVVERVARDVIHLFSNTETNNNHKQENVDHTSLPKENVAATLQQHVARLKRETEEEEEIPETTTEDLRKKYRRKYVPRRKQRSAEYVTPKPNDQIVEDDQYVEQISAEQVVEEKEDKYIQLIKKTSHDKKTKRAADRTSRMIDESTSTTAPISRRVSRPVETTSNVPLEVSSESPQHVDEVTDEQNEKSSTAKQPRLPLTAFALRKNNPKIPKQVSFVASSTVAPKRFNKKAYLGSKSR